MQMTYWKEMNDIKRRAKELLQGKIYMFAMVEFIRLLLCILLSNFIFFFIEQHSKIGISLVFNILFFIVLRPLHDYTIYYMMAKCGRNQPLTVKDSVEGIRQWKRILGRPYDRINYFALEANSQWSIAEAKRDTEKSIRGKEEMLLELRKTMQYWLIPSFFTLAVPMLVVYPYVVACEYIFYQNAKRDYVEKEGILL